MAPILLAASMQGGVSQEDSLAGERFVAGVALKAVPVVLLDVATMGSFGVINLSAALQGLLSRGVHVTYVSVQVIPAV